MTDPTTPAAIARRLTPRQREALLWLYEEGYERRWYGNTGGPSDPATNTLMSLCRLRLANYRGHGGFSTFYHLLPLGRRVRAVVEAGDAT